MRYDIYIYIYIYVIRRLKVKTYDSLTLNVTTTMHVEKLDYLLQKTTLKQEIFSH